MKLYWDVHGSHSEPNAAGRHRISKIHSHVERKKDGQAIVVLQAFEAQVALEIIQTSISYIRAIQKTEPAQVWHDFAHQSVFPPGFAFEHSMLKDLQVNQRHERDDIPVHLPQQFSRGFVIPARSFDIADDLHGPSRAIDCEARFSFSCVVHNELCRCAFPDDRR